jgi:hypothetical protein
METVAVAPAARDAMLQVNVPAEPTDGGVQLQPPPGDTNETNVVLAGVGLEKVTAVAAAEPWLRITCVYVTLLFTASASGDAMLLSVTSAPAAVPTVVADNAVLLALLGSKDRDAA